MWTCKYSESYPYIRVCKILVIGHDTRSSFDKAKGDGQAILHTRVP